MPTPAEVYWERAVELDGKSYPITRANYSTEGLFKDYLDKQALLDAERTGAGSRPETLAMLLRETRRDVTARLYAWGMPEWARCLQSVGHLKYLFYLLLRQRNPRTNEFPNPGMTEALASKIFEANWHWLLDGQKVPADTPGAVNALNEIITDAISPPADPPTPAPVPPPEPAKETTS